MKPVIACAAFLLLRVAFAEHAVRVVDHHGHRRGSGSLLNAGGGPYAPGLRFQHRVRICNAYPSTASIEVFGGMKMKQLTPAPMPYRTCQELRIPLQVGERLQFKLDGASAGFFSIADLPASDAVLFIAIYRHDTLSTAVSFKSHVFANLLNAQVAVLDTYRGDESGVPAIVDTAAGGREQNRTERLRYNSVVALNEGSYEIDLVGGDGQNVATSKLVALGRESYVVIRTGVMPEQGMSFPQEVVIFPASDPALLHSAAPRRGGLLQALALVSMAVLVAVR